MEITLDCDEEMFRLANTRLLEKRRLILQNKISEEKANCLQICKQEGKKRKPGKGEISTLTISLKEYVKTIRKKIVSPSHEYYQAWVEITDKLTSDATQNIICKDGFVTITLNNVVIKNEIENFLSESLLAALKEKLPDKTIRSLRFKMAE